MRVRTQLVCNRRHTHYFKLYLKVVVWAEMLARLSLLLTCSGCSALCLLCAVCPSDLPPAKSAELFAEVVRTKDRRAVITLLLWKQQLHTSFTLTMALRLAASRTVTGLSRRSAFAASVGHGGKFMYASARRHQSAVVGRGRDGHIE